MNPSVDFKLVQAAVLNILWLLCHPALGRIPTLVVSSGKLSLITAESSHPGLLFYKKLCILDTELRKFIAS